MRILILGNNYSAECFYDSLKKNKNDIVFSTSVNTEDYLNLNNENDIIDFCEANEINLVIITEENFISSDLFEKLNDLNVSIFSPTEEAVNICKFKSYAKKFMHKNKITSPRFFIAEKPVAAFDYIKSVNFPLAIRPDNHNFQECTQFCETYSSSKQIINKFFENGNQKIVIEDYIQGKNITVWTLSDGYSAKIIGTVAKYQNNIAYLEPDFINEELKLKITEEIIKPTINALCAQQEEYMGILGFDIILGYDNKLYLIGFNSFFDDISAKLFTNCYDINWANVFESCIIGDAFSKYEFCANDEYALTIRENEQISFISAKTKANLKRYLDELDYNTEEIREAVKIWKY